jgi:hypothetical protein
LGIGDWGLGIGGDWGLLDEIRPNMQSPIVLGLLDFFNFLKKLIKIIINTKIQKN